VPLLAQRGQRLAHARKEDGGFQLNDSPGFRA
jgi:hypothetical protein